MVDKIRLSARHPLAAGFTAATLVLTLIGFGTSGAVAATNTTAKPEITVDPTSAHGGDDVNVSGTGLAPGQVELRLASEILSPANADDDGDLSTIIKLPDELEAGQYRLTAQDSQHSKATTNLTIMDGKGDQSANQLQLTTTDTEVKIGDTIHLTLEGPEELLAKHNLDDGTLLPQSELTNTVGQKGQFSNTNLKLVDTTDGSRVFQYVVPEYQPTTNVFDDVGTVSPGVHFTFSAAIVAHSDEPQDNITSNEVTIVVVGNGSDTRHNSSQAFDPALTVDPGISTLQQFVGDPNDGAGVTHVVEGLTPDTEISYTVAGPTNVKALTQTATADDNGQVEFTVHGVESAPHVAYVGDYTTFVTIDGDHPRLASHFSVTGQVFEGTNAQRDEIVLLGADLAGTRASHTNILFFTAALLVIAGVVVVYTNRRRLFSKRGSEQ